MRGKGVLYYSELLSKGLYLFNTRPLSEASPALGSAFNAPAQLLPDSYQEYNREPTDTNAVPRSAAGSRREETCPTCWLSVQFLDASSPACCPTDPRGTVDLLQVLHGRRHYFCHL